MFFFSRDDFTSRVASPVMCPLQRIGIWRFEAAIRTIIIITVDSGEQATEANTVASTQSDTADIDSM